MRPDTAAPRSSLETDQTGHIENNVACKTGDFGIFRSGTRTVMIVAVLVLLFAGFAEAATTNLSNYTQRTVKVCVYAANDTTMIVPKLCWTIRPKQTVYWNRTEKPTVVFHVKVFQPGTLDRMICAKTNLVTVSMILVGECEITTVKYSPPTRGRAAPSEIRFCNRSAAEPIWVIIAFWDSRDSNAVGWTSQGWWKVDADQCTRVSFNSGLPEYLYVYGTTDGIVKKVWEGNDADLCINTQHDFEIKQSEKGSCFGANRARVGMHKWVIKPGSTDWTF